MNRLLFWIACLLWLIVWQQNRIDLLGWPSWEATLWLGCLMGVVGLALQWLATSGRNGLTQSVGLTALAGLSSFGTASILPGSFANRFWMWLVWCGMSFGLMFLATFIERFQARPASNTNQNRRHGLNASQISIAGWILLTAGLGLLFSLGRYIPWSADISLTAARFFLLPSMFWGWFTYRTRASGMENLLTMLCFAAAALAWYGFWATSIEEQLQLTVMILVQTAFVFAGVRISPRYSQDSKDSEDSLEQSDTLSDEPVSILPFRRPVDTDAEDRPQNSE